MKSSVRWQQNKMLQVLPRNQLHPTEEILDTE
jgi:hypothetical protein